MSAFTAPIIATVHIQPKKDAPIAAHPSFLSDQ